MKRLLFAAAGLAALLAGCADPGAGKEAQREKAREALTWIVQQASAAKAQPIGGAAWYTSDNLHEYINGAAPGYVEAGFVLLAHSEWKDPERQDDAYVELDVYDMGSAAGVAKVFQEPPPDSTLELAPDAKAYLGETGLEFGVGRYYVKVTARRDAAGQRPFVERLARAVVAAAPPEIVPGPPPAP
jgi:hypothetical protein